MLPFYYLYRVLKEFESNIVKKELFHKKEKLLLAISGGSDSVVLAHLLKAAGYKFSLAHCNFQLRGKDSDTDENFCKALSKKLGVKLYTKHFDTQAYCIANKATIQVAARNLRYQWFNELLKEHDYAYLLTAHNANDVVETIFINLLRGTGIKGIKGISEKAEQLIRPLLNFTKEEIESYAKKKEIQFRLDQSNLEDKYERNFLRLNVIPLLKKINPNLEETFTKNAGNFKEESEIVKDYLEQRSMDLLTQTPGLIFINKKKLKREKYIKSVLHYIVCGYGFNETQEKNILKNIITDALPGKTFTSGTHQLTIDRNDLIIKPLLKEVFSDEIYSTFEDLENQKTFIVQTLKKFVIPEKNELILQKDHLVFPLILRKKQTGDRFKPFGMKGFKLLSDFLKDEKANSVEKENCLVLVNGNAEIIWVIGRRSDDRYKVDQNKKVFLKLSLIE
ncbi:tRNA lysidine(34) synthetase TilS [Sphingobacteriaceae bacterium]|nr:tRNA lysidine(34) synthetase TilS [Sphingobacteriaceae bacterium]